MPVLSAVPVTWSSLAARHGVRQKHCVAYASFGWCAAHKTTDDARWLSEFTGISDCVHLSRWSRYVSRCSSTNILTRWRPGRSMTDQRPTYTSGQPKPIQVQQVPRARRSARPGVSRATRPASRLRCALGPALPSPTPFAPQPSVSRRRHAHPLWSGVAR